MCEHKFPKVPAIEHIRGGPNGGRRLQWHCNNCLAVKLTIETDKPPTTKTVIVEP